MAKHTPGPWGVGTSYWARLDYESEDAPKRVSHYWVSGPGAIVIVNEADAHLIAAAPDLLAACEAVVSAYASGQAYDKCPLGVVKAAIAKAKGEE